MLDLILFPYFFVIAKRRIPLNKYGGKGTKENPILITKSDFFPEEPLIYKSKKYILLNKLVIDELELFKCKNIIIQECEFNVLTIWKSMILEIRNSTILSTLKIVKSVKITLDSSEINEFDSFSNSENIITDCNISKINQNQENK
ncbi:MAG: hypothetical protein KGD65_16535 [Candidatus Lokiarchaeota archaeon]|nr:hypothetical protein [Candidatus Lokiarchaeota archaeon]